VSDAEFDLGASRDGLARANAALLAAVAERDRLASDVETRMSFGKPALRTRIYAAAAEPAGLSEAIAAFADRTASLTASAPVASIVVYLGDTVEPIIRCLRSLAQTSNAAVPIEIIVVTDAPPGAHDRRALSRIAGVRFIGRDRPLDRSVALGRFIVFLDERAVVTAGWLEALIARTERDATVAAVCPKIVDTNGELMEAGSIVWRSGEVDRYGASDDPADLRYAFARYIDACSGTAFLVRADVVGACGGSFDARFASMPYRTADLCMTMSAQNFHIAYENTSVVVGDTTSPCPPETGVFQAKWKAELDRDHFDRENVSAHRAARRANGRRSVLVVDTFAPMHDREAGAQRLMHVIRHLLAEDYRVIFSPVLSTELRVYVEELQALRVEVLPPSKTSVDFEARFDEALIDIDFAWLCRPELTEPVIPKIRDRSHARVIYDTIDLHFVRMRREFELTGKAADPSWESVRDREFACARASDATITVTDVERSTLGSLGISPIYVVPTMHKRVVAAPANFENTANLLFIGGYRHTPNVDAVEWLISEIMPEIWREFPDMNVTLLGSYPTQAVRDLAGTHVAVPGYVPDVAPYFRSHRVFVAPLRFGAGLKGKIGEALSFGIPTVTTPIGAEGFDLTDGVDACIANDATTFAEAVVRLYRDRAAWERVASGGLAAVTRLAPDAFDATLRHVFADVTSRSA